MASSDMYRLQGLIIHDFTVEEVTIVEGKESSQVSEDLQYLCPNRRSSGRRVCFRGELPSFSGYVISNLARIDVLTFKEVCQT